MNVALFTHSLVSDWNHGNAHFLRGVATELHSRGHRVRAYEPRDGWSVTNLLAEMGADALRGFRRAFPALRPVRYERARLDLDRELHDADLVIVHEWNDPELVHAIGEHRARHGGYRLLFHDTHHRAVSARDAIASFDLSGYDGVLAFGRSLRDLYLASGWTRDAFVWHEAADTRVFRPRGFGTHDRDLVWIGNWGDDERAEELREFLFEPVRRLRLRARVYGVRWPREAIAECERAGIEFAGFIPNSEVPAAFARSRVTIHVPRRPYVRALPGIPTIRPFEALACGIPLVMAPWNDVEGLFRPGHDHLRARDGDEMTRHIRAVLDDPVLARSLASAGRRTILSRHTCAHRVDELLALTGAQSVAAA